MHGNNHIDAVTDRDLTLGRQLERILDKTDGTLQSQLLAVSFLALVSLLDLTVDEWLDDGLSIARRNAWNPLNATNRIKTVDRAFA
jgi:hypothetical protein